MSIRYASPLLCFTHFACVNSYSDLCSSSQAILGNDVNAHSGSGSIRGVFNVSESLYVTTAGTGTIELRANLLDGRAPDKRYSYFDDIEKPEHIAPTRLHMFSGTG